MIKIADGNLVLHNVPLPEIRYADSTLTLELDDEHFRRKTVVFSPIQGIKLTANDCADIPTAEKSFSSGRYKRYVLEDTDSAWVKELRNGIIDKNDDFTKKTRHFIIDIGDELLEIAAWNMEIKPCIYVAAHRGYSEKYPENTMEAFRAAIEAGADEIETDVRITADGELVLIHDAALDRTTDGSGEVGSFTLAELKKLDAGIKKDESFAGARIPTLRELLELVKDTERVTLDIELKEYPTEGREAVAYEACDKALAMLDEYGFTDRCVINSWNGKLNEYVREKYGDRYKQHVYYPEELLGECRADPYSYAYCACLFTNNPEAYDYLRSRGVQPWAGAGVKDEETLDKVIKNGAMLITCNDPAEILGLLRKKGLHK